MLPSSRVWSVVSAAVVALLVSYLLEAPARAATTSVTPSASLSSVTASTTASVVAKKKAKKNKKAKKRAKRLARQLAAAPAAPAAPTIMTPCGPQLTWPDGRVRRCTFTEDFNGSSLDSSKWMVLTAGNTGLKTAPGDCLVNDPRNVRVYNGALQLTTRRETIPCVNQQGEAFTSTHTSATVSTYSKFDQAYGRWEIRARFPTVTTPGSQAALWMLPTNPGPLPWPTSGEIDIVEFFSHYPDRGIPFLHYVSKTLDFSVTNNYCMLDGPTEFHTYLLDWRPGRITVKIDGKTCIDHVVNPAAPLFGSAPFDKRYFLNLSQILGRGKNAPSANTPAVLTTQVDWVRIWE
jgi:beta-glucanase (GH16 family)